MAESISIIMNVYNGERFLPEALDSVRDQTFTDYEFVIVDDGSTDRTADILREYAARDPRLVLAFQQNRGVTAASNHAIRLAKHELLARMDCDDRMLPNRLAQQAAFMAAHPEVSVACSYAYIINAEGQRVSVSSHDVDIELGKKELNPSRFLEIINPSVIMRKADVVEVGGFNETLPSTGDRELWGRMVTAGKLIVSVPEILMEYRIHSGGVTAGRSLKRRQIVRFIDTNIIRRLQGLPDRTQAEYDAWWRQLPWWERFAQERRSVANFYYKRATRAYSEKKMLDFAGLAFMAIAIRPFFMSKRMLGKLGAGGAKNAAVTG